MFFLSEYAGVNNLYAIRNQRIELRKLSTTILESLRTGFTKA